MSVLGLVVWPLAPSVVPGVVLLLLALLATLVWAVLGGKNNSRS